MQAGLQSSERELLRALLGAKLIIFCEKKENNAGFSFRIRSSIFFRPTKFLFQTLKHMLQSLKHISQSLKHTLQSLKQKYHLLKKISNHSIN